MDVADNCVPQEQFTFNSIEVLNCGIATEVKSYYVTCPAIMTEILIEDVWMIRFEYDCWTRHVA